MKRLFLILGLLATVSTQAANNIDVKDGGGTTVTLKTTDNATVHTPHSNIDTLPGTVETDIGAIKTATELIDNAIAGTEMQVDVVGPLPAGTNNIGDVDIITFPDNEPFNVAQIGGTAVAAGSGINGLGVQRVTVATDDTVATDLTAIKTAVEILDNIVGGSEAQVDIVSFPDNEPINVAQMNGIAVSMGSGINGTGVQRVTIATDDANVLAIKTATELIDNAISGTEMQVDIVAALPAGANTIGTVNVGTFPDNEPINVAQMNGVAVSMGAGINGTGVQRVTVATDDTVATDLTAIRTAVQLIDNSISGSETQVDVVAALPAGTNNIGDVDVVSFPDNEPFNVAQLGGNTITTGSGVTGTGVLRVTQATDVDVSTKPFSALLEGAVTELIGINEQVDQNEYAASVGVSLGGTYSGEILQITLIATEDGTGAVIGQDGVLFFMDADPATTAGDTALAATEWPTVIAKIPVTGNDYSTDAGGGAVTITTPVAFHALSTIYVVYQHTGATSFNDAAGDDEQLEVNFWYRRDS